MKCFFCQYKTDPSFKDIDNLQKFLSPRKKIMNREDTNVCAKHQRKLAKAIKRSRFLALLPFIAE